LAEWECTDYVPVKTHGISLRPYQGGYTEKKLYEKLIEIHGWQLGEKIHGYEDSYATGNVTGEHDVGGLLGGGAAVINRSYATGTITGDGYDVAGLAAMIDATGSIQNSYTTSRVICSGSCSYVGGLVGFTSSGTNFEVFSNNSWTNHTDDDACVNDWDAGGACVLRT
jgi:hypothetical protein